MGDNWAWRYRAEAINGWVSNRLRELVDLYGRDPKLWLKKSEEEQEDQEDDNFLPLSSSGSVPDQDW